MEIVSVSFATYTTHKPSGEAFHANGPHHSSIVARWVQHWLELTHCLSPIDADQGTHGERTDVLADESD